MADTPLLPTVPQDPAGQQAFVNFLLDPHSAQSVPAASTPPPANVLKSLLMAANPQSTQMPAPTTVPQMAGIPSTMPVQAPQIANLGPMADAPSLAPQTYVNSPTGDTSLLSHLLPRDATPLQQSPLSQVAQTPQSEVTTPPIEAPAVSAPAVIPAAQTSQPADASQDIAPNMQSPTAPKFSPYPARPTPTPMPNQKLGIGDVASRLIAALIGNSAGGIRAAAGAEGGVEGEQNTQMQRALQDWQNQNAAKSQGYEDSLKGTDAQNTFNQGVYKDQITQADAQSAAAARVTAAKQVAQARQDSIDATAQAKAAELKRQLTADQNADVGRKLDVIKGFFANSPLEAYNNASTFAANEADPKVRAIYQGEADSIKAGIASGEYPNLMLDKDKNIIAAAGEKGAQTQKIQQQIASGADADFGKVLLAAGNAQTPAQKNAIIDEYNSTHHADILAGKADYIPREGEVYKGATIHYTPSSTQQSTIDYQGSQAAGVDARTANIQVLDKIAQQNADAHTSEAKSAGQRTQMEGDRTYGTNGAIQTGSKATGKGADPGVNGFGKDYDEATKQAEGLSNKRDAAIHALRGAQEDLKNNTGITAQDVQDKQNQVDNLTSQLNEANNNRVRTQNAWNSAHGSTSAFTTPTPSRRIQGRNDPVSSDVMKYSGAIQSAAKQYGIPAEVLASTLQQESGGDIHQYTANKVGGARGIAQFIPSTAKQYGVDVNDPASSINGMAHYLSDLKNGNGGSMSKALQQYSGNTPNYAAEVLNRAGLNRAARAAAGRPGGNQTATTKTDYSTMSTGDIGRRMAAAMAKLK